MAFIAIGVLFVLLNLRTEAQRGTERLDGGEPLLLIQGGIVNAFIGLQNGGGILPADVVGKVESAVEGLVEEISGVIRRVRPLG